MARSEVLENNGRRDSLASFQGKSFENTLAFVSDPRVSSFPIDTKVQTPPRHPNMTQEQWERGWEAIGEYLGTDKTQDEVANGRFSKERFRNILKSRIKHLHQAQSEEIKLEYPLLQFDYKKPLSVSSRRKISKALGGIAVQIEKAILEGQTLLQLQQHFSTGQLSSARQILPDWGVKVPYEKSRIRPRFKELKNPELSDEEKQKLLDKIGKINELRVLSSGEEPLIIYVSQIARQAGLYFKLDKVNSIYKFLRSKNIPVSTISYDYKSRSGDKKRIKGTVYYICAIDKDRAIEAIKSAEELDRLKENPVTVLGLVPDKIPRYGELQNSGNYSRLGSLITEIRGKRLGGHIKTEDIILDDCPASVYQHKWNLFYRLDQHQQLRAYIEKRLRELGRI